MTQIRIFFARVLYGGLHTVLRKDHRLIQRNGIRYSVDLSEGIDLSIFLFGSFQDHIINNAHVSLPDDATVIDVGANVGSMALRFSQLVPHGHVFAFEPTDYAFNKLLQNLALNPELADRITPNQLFLTDQSKTDHQITAYSSWKVDGSATGAHPLHGGSLKAAHSIPAMSLDDYCRANHIDRVDLIKIDTDGHELPVLEGARATIRDHRPYLIFEIGLYVLQERGTRFEQYFDYLSAFDYTLINCRNGEEVVPMNYRKQIPSRSTIDIVAVSPRSLAP
jgi:FkbM family methyltransferase